MIRTEAISFNYSHIAHPESVPVPGASVARHSLIVALPCWVRPSGLRRNANNTAGSKPGEGDEKPFAWRLADGRQFCATLRRSRCGASTDLEIELGQRPQMMSASPAARLE